jgi:archaellin
MVVFHKLTELTNANVEALCKVMVNIESNAHIYNDAGERINSKLPFNCYKFQSVEYNIDVSIGFIKCPYATATSLRNAVVNYFNINTQMRSTNKHPQNIIANKTTDYTLITNDPAPLRTRSILSHNCDRTTYRSIIDDVRDINKTITKGARFVWVFPNRTEYTYNATSIVIPEMSLNHNSSSEYLMASISTIITNDLYNVSNTKQIDYPNIAQYRMYDEYRLMIGNIKISQLHGLMFEIMDNYVDYSYVVISITSVSDSIDLKQVKAMRRNPDKEWYNQINDVFDYDKQEEDERNIDETGKPAFPLNVCFITQAPLYNKAYVIKCHKQQTSAVTTSTEPVVETESKNNDPISIIVSDAIYRIIHINNKSKRSFKPYFETKTKFTIDRIYQCNIDATELDAINKLDIDPLKKEIMLSINQYGMCCEQGNHYYHTSITCYTLNLALNKIYVGKTNKIGDTDVNTYYNTNTTLFGYTII